MTTAKSSNPKPEKENPVPPVLVIEDSDHDYRALLRAFKKSGMANDLCRCETAHEAFALMQGKESALLPGSSSATLARPYKPSLILLDLNLPGMDGREFLKTIKTNEKTKAIPVVVLTTSSDDGDIMISQRYGASSYIVKPVDTARLYELAEMIKDHWTGVQPLPAIVR